MRVLLVDDNAPVRQALALVLRSEPDMEIVGEAETGRAAIEQTRVIHPHVILMDLSMPVLNGLDATKAIHAEHPAVCIIVMSVHEYVGETLRRAGAFESVSKAEPIENLLTAMRACYAQRHEHGRPATAA